MSKDKKIDREQTVACLRRYIATLAERETDPRKKEELECQVSRLDNGTYFGEKDDV